MHLPYWEQSFYNQNYKTQSNRENSIYMKQVIKAIFNNFQTCDVLACQHY